MQLDVGNNIWLRFFLVVADHDAVPNKKQPGLLEPGTKGCNDTLNLKYWRGLNDSITIEHIIPQNPKSTKDWDNELYLPQNMQSLGNLTILPKQKNSIAGNRNWAFKKQLFKILSENSKKARLTKIENLAKKEGIELTKKTKRILADAHHWPAVSAIVPVNTWTPQLVKARASNLVEMAWETFSQWLL